MSEDPLGLEAGDTNYYRYVFNRPVNKNDPTGKLSAAQVVILVVAAFACWAVASRSAITEVTKRIVDRIMGSSDSNDSSKDGDKTKETQPSR